MDRMLVAVFDTENKAFEGAKALLELDCEGSICLYTDAVISKNADGTSTVKGGITADLNNVRIDGEFVDDVTQVLVPNRFAVIAEIEEEWTTPVDARMEAIGGTVFRQGFSELKDTVAEEDIAALKADIAQLEIEHLKARTERKAKLAETINQLDIKLQTCPELDKQQRQAARVRAQAKLEFEKTRAIHARAKAAS